jgi:hypothetical protein
MEAFLLIVILVVLLLALIFITTQMYNIIFRGFAPFVSTKFHAILSILKELNLNGNETVYELGAGKAGFLRAVEQKFKNEKLIGIEYSWWPYLLARMQTMITGSNIKMIKKNIFKISLKEADVIYCFLVPKMMDRLAEKFKKECRPGTLIISYKFGVSGFDPEKVIKEGDYNIYFYRI